MGEKRSNSDSGTTAESEEAINEVLLAERRAREAISRCEAEAAEQLDAARRQARHIAERTSARISRLHSVCADSANTEVETLLQRQEAAEEQAAPRPHDRELLAAAVAYLSKGLTSDEPPGEG